MARGEDTSKHPSRKVDREAAYKSMFGQIMGTEKPSSQKRAEANEDLIEQIMGKEDKD